MNCCINHYCIISCCIAWYFVLYYIVFRCITLCCVVLRFFAVRCGVVWCGIHSLVWCGAHSDVCCSAAQHGRWCGAVLFRTVRYGAVLCCCLPNLKGEYYSLGIIMGVNDRNVLLRLCLDMHCLESFQGRRKEMLTDLRTCPVCIESLETVTHFLVQSSGYGR